MRVPTSAIRRGSVRPGNDMCVFFFRNHVTGFCFFFRFNIPFNLFVLCKTHLAKTAINETHARTCV
jgi:hypothetical protein